MHIAYRLLHQATSSLRAVRYVATIAPASAKTTSQGRSTMDNKQNVTGGGIKVTYIETQFVTSDAAGFKELVQRLTGRSAPPPPVPHRPFPCRPDDGRRGRSRTAAGAGAGPQAGYHYTAAEEEVRPAVSGVSRAPTYLEDMGLHDFIDMADFSDLFYDVAAASERSDACYGGSLPY